VKVTILFNLENKFAFKSYKYLKAKFIKDKSNFQGVMTLISSIFLKKHLVDRRVIIPESSNKMMVGTCEKLGLDYLVVKKNKASEIFISILSDDNLQKTQKDSLIAMLHLMGNPVKMNKLKANHRKIIAKYLFVDYDKQDNDILFDDSYFSGSTASFFNIDTVALFGFKRKVSNEF